MQTPKEFGFATIPNPNIKILGKAWEGFHFHRHAYYDSSLRGFKCNSNPETGHMKETAPEGPSIWSGEVNVRCEMLGSGTVLQ